MNRIKEIRKKAGMMQKDLADLADISKPFLCDLENNRRGAKKETMQRIASALGVEEKDLIVAKEVG